MEIKQNASTVDEAMGTTRMVTKEDGTKVPFSEASLLQSLENQLAGLNQEFISLDIIMAKVSSGLYNGKHELLITSLGCRLFHFGKRLCIAFLVIDMPWRLFVCHQTNFLLFNYNRGDND